MGRNQLAGILPPELGNMSSLRKFRFMQSRMFVCLHCAACFGLGPVLLTSDNASITFVLTQSNCRIPNAIYLQSAFACMETNSLAPFLLSFSIPMLVSFGFRV